MSNQEIIDYFSSQDEQLKALAYEYCYHTTFPKLLNFIGSYDGNYHDAQDIVQEAITIFHKKCIFNSIPKGSPIAYIIGTGRKLWFKRYNTYFKDTNLIPPVEGENDKDSHTSPSIFSRLESEDNTEEIEAREKKEQDLIDLVDSLRPDEQELIRLYFGEGWTWVEIANLWGKPSGTIRQKWNRLKDRLRGRLGGLGYSSSA